MKRIVKRSFVREEKAATLVEFTLLAPLLFLITFGIAEFGWVFYQYQSLNAATAAAARMAATRGPVITGIPDCGVGVASTAGAYCSTAAGSKTWAPVTCTGAAPGGNCNTVLMDRIVTEMRIFYPNMQRANLNITFGPSGLGFQGLGKPVPMVTVTVTGVTANFIAINAFGVPNIPMPTFTTTLPAEDLSGT